METVEIFNRVKKAAPYWTGDRPELIKDHERFVADLGFDSLDQIEMVMEMESEFEIEISDEDAEKVQTIADAVELVERLVKPNVEVTGGRPQAPPGLTTTQPQTAKRR